MESSSIDIQLISFLVFEGEGPAANVEGQSDVLAGGDSHHTEGLEEED